MENQPRSTFVTVVAWIFIALSGMGTFVAILQNVMIYTVFRRPEVAQAMQASQPAGAPPIALFMLAHIQWFFMGFLILSIFMLVSAIGLLRRRNWARLCFIGMMVLAIVWQLVGVIVQIVMFSSMREQFAMQAAPGMPDMSLFFIAASVFGALFAISFCVLFGWIIRRLVSAPVVAEFHR